MREDLIDVALGRREADAVLKNGSYVNVFTGEVLHGDIAVAGGKIAGIGVYKGKKEYDKRASLREKSDLREMERFIKKF